LEGTTANDIPNATAEVDEQIPPNPVCRLGDGPALTVMDSSLIVPPQLINFLRATADKNKIPYQLKTSLGGGTDAGSIHRANAGIPSAVVSVPCRYIHAPTAYLNRDDYNNTLKLLQAVLKDIKWEDVRPLGQ
jgi:putative aminopeptidase FrvX